MLRRWLAAFAALPGAAAAPAAMGPIITVRAPFGDNSPEWAGGGRACTGDD